MDRFWRRKTFDTAGVPNLPRVMHFSQCTTHQKVRLNYALVSEVENILPSIVREAASHGDNVGMDEFDQFLEEWTSYSEIFICRDHKTEDLLCFFLISPSPYSRSYDSLLAQLIIFRSSLVVHDDAFYRHLLTIALEFVVSLELGYRLVSINVSLNCKNLLAILREEGFNISAIIPSCVLMTPRSLQPSAMLVKQLSDDKDRNPRPLTEVLEQCSLKQPEISEEEYRRTELPKLSFVPFNYTFRCGITVKCRSLRHDEDHLIYEIIRQAGEHGSGYTKNEHPSLNEFRHSVLLPYPCVVYEDLNTKEFIGSTILIDSWFSRTGSVKIGQTNTLVSEKFRGRGIGYEMGMLDLAMMKEMGYQVFVNDVLANGKMLSISVKQGFTLVGTYPKAGYTDSEGWIDSLLVYVDLINDCRFNKSLSQLLDDNRQKCKL